MRRATKDLHFASSAVILPAPSEAEGSAAKDLHLQSRQNLYQL
jgi:hypothetical protein